ncbi:MAG: hypothetical protein HY914_05935 [Desulfomonile tiedjei]|nr:hypothetical protein [Desulfomonile tiedjei]
MASYLRAPIVDLVNVLDTSIVRGEIARQLTILDPATYTSEMVSNCVDSSLGSLLLRYPSIPGAFLQFTAQVIFVLLEMVLAQTSGWDVAKWASLVLVAVFITWNVYVGSIGWRIMKTAVEVASVPSTRQDHEHLQYLLNDGFTVVLVTLHTFAVFLTGGLHSPFVSALFMFSAIALSSVRNTMTSGNRFVLVLWIAALPLLGTCGAPPGLVPAPTAPWLPPAASILILGYRILSAVLPQSEEVARIQQ